MPSSMSMHNWKPGPDLSYNSPGFAAGAPFMTAEGSKKVIVSSQRTACGDTHPRFRTFVERPTSEGNAGRSALRREFHRDHGMIVLRCPVNFSQSE